MRTLIFDIESSPNISATWGMWEQNVVWLEKAWQLLSFAYKWEGENKVYVLALSDFSGKDREKKLTKALWDLVNEADIIVAHNGDKFDIRKSNAKFLEFGLTPPSPYRTVDTLKIARKNFALNSNKLDDLAQLLGVGMKETTGGYQLWKDCMEGKEEAWKKMKKYNRHDVILLDKVYQTLRPWMKSHPNMGVDCDGDVCPFCQSDKIQKRGKGFSQSGHYQRYVCTVCAGWSKGKTISSGLNIK